MSDNKMQLVRYYDWYPDHEHYAECIRLTEISARLWDDIVSIHQQNHRDKKKFIPKWKIAELLRLEENANYYALNTTVSNYVVDQVHNAYVATFRAIAARREAKKKHKNAPRINFPKLKGEGGRNKVSFHKSRLLKNTFKKEGLVHLSMTTIKFKTNIPFEQIQEVSIVPRKGFFRIIVIYNVVPAPQVVSDIVAAGDPGNVNLITVVTNNSEPFIVSAGPVNSINYKADKEIDRLSNKLPKGQTTSKLIQNIQKRRNNKIKNYMHHASTRIVDELSVIGVSLFVVGHNKNWKNGSRIGKRNNRTFQKIPHTQFFEMLRYKSILRGINFLEGEESYTSLCSFLDDEEICKHETYMGKRIKRGLFRSSDGTLINADAQAACNILRKHLGMSLSDFDLGRVLGTPRRLRLSCFTRPSGRKRVRNNKSVRRPKGLQSKFL